MATIDRRLALPKGLDFRSGGNLVRGI